MGFTNTSRAPDSTPDPDRQSTHQTRFVLKRKPAEGRLYKYKPSTRGNARPRWRMQAPSMPKAGFTNTSRAPENGSREPDGTPAPNMFRIQKRKNAEAPSMFFITRGSPPKPDRRHRHQTRPVLKKKACRRQALQIQAEHPKIQAENPMARRHQTCFELKKKACRRQALQIQAEHPRLRQTQVEDAGTKHVLHYVGQPAEPQTEDTDTKHALY